MAKKIELSATQRKQLLGRENGSGFLAVKSREGVVTLVEFYLDHNGQVLAYDGDYPIQLEFDEFVGIEKPDHTHRVWLKAEEA